RLAVAQALNKLAAAQVAFTRSAIRSAQVGAEAWLAVQGDRFARVRTMLPEIAGEGPLTVARLLVAAGQLSELMEAEPVAPAAGASTGGAVGRSKSAASGNPPARRRARLPRT